MTNKKTIVTMRSIKDGQHYFISCSDTLEALRTAQKLHKLGDHSYRQVRLRSTVPSLRTYNWVNLVKWIGA